MELSEISAVGFLEKMESKVHLGEPHFKIKPADRELADPRAYQWQNLQEDLKNRIAARVAVGLQRLHHHLKWHVLVRKRLENCLPALPQQFDERRIPGEPGADRHHVQEIPDQAFEFSQWPARDRCPDDDLLRSRIANEEHLKCGGDRGEERASLLRAERTQRLRERARNRKADGGTVE